MLNVYMRSSCLRRCGVSRQVPAIGDLGSNYFGEMVYPVVMSQGAGLKLTGSGVKVRLSSSRGGGGPATMSFVGGGTDGRWQDQVGRGAGSRERVAIGVLGQGQ